MGKITIDDQATPMATWYVESDESIYVSNPDHESEQYGVYGDWDNSGHTRDLSGREQVDFKDHIDSANWAQ